MSIATLIDVCAGNINPWVTRIPDNSHKGIWNLVTRKPDNPLKVIHSIISNRNQNLWFMGLTVQT